MSDWTPAARAEVVRMLSEGERLRQVLQQIVDIDWHVGDSAIDAMNEAQRLAREALDGPCSPHPADYVDPLELR